MTPPSPPYRLNARGGLSDEGAAQKTWRPGRVNAPVNAPGRCHAPLASIAAGRPFAARVGTAFQRPVRQQADSLRVAEVPFAVPRPGLLDDPALARQAERVAGE